VLYNIQYKHWMVKGETDITFEKLFEFPLAPVPWSLATADGCMFKTNKSQLMHLLEGKQPTLTVDSCAGVAQVTLPAESVHIVDGNALHGGASVMSGITCFPCVGKGWSRALCNSYKSASIKLPERIKCGSLPTYVNAGAKTKLPRDFRSFLLNDDNKVSE